MQTKTIGRMPTDHGPYVPGQAYGKKFQVDLYGCVWESKHDNNSTAPATLNAQAGTITPNTTDWKKVTGSTDQWLIDNGYKNTPASHVTDSNQNNKTQQQINTEVKTEIGTDSTPASVKGRIKSLENSVGTGGSVDQRIAAVVGDATSAGNTLEKLEDRLSPVEKALGSGGSVDSRIYTAVGAEATARANAVSAEASRAQAAESNLQQLYEALTQSDIEVVNAVPASGVANKIYRVVGETSYSDYMFNSSDLNTPIKMATYDNAIDPEPISESHNLVQSGGVYKQINLTYQEQISPSENELKKFLINGKINESTGAIIRGSQTRLTTSIYFKKVYYNYLVIDQTASNTKFLFAAYKHTELGTPPDWINYQNTNIINIPLEDGYFYSLYIAAPNDVAIHPEDLESVKIVYGFYDDSRNKWESKIEKKCIILSDVTNIIDDASGVFLDLGSDPGIFIDGKVYWLASLLPDSDSYRKINLTQHTYPESGYRAIVFDIKNNIIQNIPYASITNLPERQKGRFIIICTFTNNGQRIPKNIQGINYTINGDSPFELITKKYYLLSPTTPDIIANESETYMDFGADPGIFINGKVYWFVNWYPNDSDAYRKINLRYHFGEESSLRAIIADLVNHTIDNVSYATIKNNVEQYRNCIVLFTFNSVAGKPRCLQGINYTVNGGSDSIVELNPDIITKVANSAWTFHWGEEGNQTIAKAPVNLLYFSDIHGDVDRTKRLFDFKKNISNYIDDILFTGDSDNYPNNTNWWNDYAKQMLISLGNHEYMVENVGGVWQHATPQQVYDKFIAPYKSYWSGVVFPSNPETGKSYFYKDYAAKNLRLISLDYMEINLNPDSTQISWLTSILNDVLTNHPNYHVVIAVHQCAFLAEQDFRNPFDSLDVRSDSDGVINVGIPNVVDTFINNGGHFVCYLTGHNHTDHFGLGVAYPKQLNVSIACASATVYANVLDIRRVIGTKSQDLFNIVSIDTYSSIIKMIRVGCDYDRQLRKKDTICFYYGNEEFDQNETYRVGKIVKYQNKIYQFMRNYNGSEWNPSIVKEIDRLIFVS